MSLRKNEKGYPMNDNTLRPIISAEQSLEIEILRADLAGTKAEWFKQQREWAEREQDYARKLATAELRADALREMAIVSVLHRYLGGENMRPRMDAKTAEAVMDRTDSERLALAQA